MRSSSTAVRDAPLDSERFGFRVGRLDGVPAEKAAQLVQRSRERGYELLIARCPTTDTRAASALEGVGGRLVDTLVYYRHELREEPAPAEPGLAIRPLGEEDADAVAEVARGAFAGYQGHYQVDPRLDGTKGDAAYEDWARRCCTEPGVAEEVLGAEEDGALVAFAALTLGERGSDLRLGAVAPEAGGRGVYSRLVGECIRWSHGRELEALEASTQLTNVRVQRLWSRLGFELSRSHYTFHLWLD